MLKILHIILYFFLIIKLFQPLCLKSLTTNINNRSGNCELSCNAFDKFIPDYNSCQCICSIGYNQIGSNCVPIVCLSGTFNDNQNCIDCGLIPVAPNVKISDGVVAKQNSYPSQIYLNKNIYGVVKYVNSEGFKLEQYVSEVYQCGGTLINRYTIITAAHCTQLRININGNYLPVEPDPFLYPTRESAFTVLLGVNDVSFLYNPEISIPESLVVVSVKKIIDHPLFNIDTLENDISLLILSEPVNLSAKIYPACLPNETSSNYPGINIDAFVAGWGSFYYTGSVSNELYNIRIKIYDSIKCEEIAIEAKKNWSQQICAGDLIGNKDTCKGDSGGGLYVYSMDGKRRIVAGIVSFGEGCGNQKPSIYTRVSYYLDWIKENWKTSDSVIS